MVGYDEYGESIDGCCQSIALQGACDPMCSLDPGSSNPPYWAAIL